MNPKFTLCSAFEIPESRPHSPELPASDHSPESLTRKLPHSDERIIKEGSLGLSTPSGFVSNDISMFATAIRYFSTKPKPKMKPIELKTPPEQTQTITRVIFDIVREHGPLTIAETWDRVQEVGLRGLTGKRHMKVVMRWMRERQKLRLMCNHVGPHKQFLYTTWFTKPNFGQGNPQGRNPSQPKSP